jgi:hypothetical protein
LWYYALTLIAVREDSDKIDAAVENWRRNSLRSDLPDPRAALKRSVPSPKTRGNPAYPR